jgi:hypothetical protein
LDAVALGHGGAAQALELREDEPDPVAAFAARAEFGKSPVKSSRLTGILNFKISTD